MIVGYYKNCLYTTDISLALKKKKGKESQYKYMVSHPETGSDSPIGSNQESGRDNEGYAWIPKTRDFTENSGKKFGKS